MSPEERFRIEELILELEKVAEVLSHELFVCKYEPRYLGSLVKEAAVALRTARNAL